MSTPKNHSAKRPSQPRHALDKKTAAENKRGFTRGLRASRPLAIALVAAFLVSTAAPAISSTEVTESYDFESVTSRDDEFTLTLGNNTTSEHITREPSIGVNGTAGIRISSTVGSTGAREAILATKTKYTMKDAPTGSVYRFSSFVRSLGANGYSGMGFSATPSSAEAEGRPDLTVALNQSDNASIYRPNNALGVSVHGSGFYFHVGTVDYRGFWKPNSVSQIPNQNVVRVTESVCQDLINRNNTDANASCASPEGWYRIDLILDIATSTTFDIEVQVRRSDAAGTSVSDIVSAYKMTGVSNSDLRNADLVSSYVNFSGDRFRQFDDYAVTLSDGATVVTLGAPIVATSSVDVLDAVADLEGEVKSENGGTVTERGFVHSTSLNPIVDSATKIAVGSGTGAFEATTSTLPSGTNYFRAYATSAAGTSYGVQVARAVQSSSPPGNAISGISSPGPRPLTAPRTPLPAEVKISNEANALRVNLGFTGAETAKPSAYNVRLSPGGATCRVNSDKGFCDIPSVRKGIEYSISIAAVNELGSSQPTALYNRVLLGSSGWLTYSKRASIDNFAGNSPKVTRQIRTKARAFGRNNPQVDYVTCVGFAAGNVATERQFDLALTRAKRICDQIKKMNPELETSVFSRVPGSAFSGANRRVLVTGYEPIS